MRAAGERCAATQFLIPNFESMTKGRPRLCSEIEVENVSQVSTEMHEYLFNGPTPIHLQRLIEHPSIFPKHRRILEENHAVGCCNTRCYSTSWGSSRCTFVCENHSACDLGPRTSNLVPPAMERGLGRCLPISTTELSMAPFHTFRLVPHKYLVLSRPAGLSTCRMFHASPFGL